VLNGANFGTGPGTVAIGGQACQVLEWSDTQIRCAPPADLEDGLPIDIQVAP